MNEITIDSLVKVYPFQKKHAVSNDPRRHYTNEGELALRGVSLKIAPHDFFVILGPSGCGKTTLLRMIAGLEDITAGTIAFGDRMINDVPTADRDIAMVTQEAGLYPHLTVEENIASPLAAMMLPQDEIEQKVSRIMRILDIYDLRKKKPRSLSGGERQLTAIGRAVIKGTELILVDEPLSNLDESSRNRIRTYLIKLHNDTDATFIYVTHSQEEALVLADHMAVMNEGRIMQAGSPESLYYEPENEFVASFLGVPPMNIFTHVPLQEQNGRIAACLGDDSIQLTEAQSSALRRNGMPAEIDIGLRPFELKLSASGLKAVIEVDERIDDEHLLHVRAGAFEFIAAAKTSSPFFTGQEICLKPMMERAVLFDSSTGNRIA